MAACGRESHLRSCNLQCQRAAAHRPCAPALPGARCFRPHQERASARASRMAAFNDDMLDHHHCVGSRGNGSTGHDFPGRARGQRSARRLTSASGADYGQGNMCRGFLGPTGISVAGRAGKGRLIAIRDTKSAPIHGQDARPSSIRSHQRPELAQSCQHIGNQRRRLIVAGQIGTHVWDCRRLRPGKSRVNEQPDAAGA